MENIEIKSKWIHPGNGKTVIVEYVTDGGIVTASYIDKASQIYGASFIINSSQFLSIFKKLKATAHIEDMDITHKIKFIESFNALADQAHNTGKEKGWWDKDRNNGELIALCHSELSEALEALRHNNPPDDKIPEYTGVEAELADCVIRIMDMASARSWRVAEAIVTKMEMNKTRPKMHGGKTF